MIEKSYEAELEIAKKDGVKEYKSELVDNKSGIIKITEIEKEYFQNHKDDFKNSEECIQSLTESITHYKEIF